MIQIYQDTDRDYEKNGTAVLHPISCTVSEEAGGSYTLRLTHPLDPRGVWKTIRTGYIIKAPVPAQMTQPVVAGDTLDVYKATRSAPVRAKPSTPSPVSYDAWEYRADSLKGYVKGDKVTFSGKNYICTQTPYGTMRKKSPAEATDYWSGIASEVGGGAILYTAKTGSFMYLLEEVGTGWYRVATLSGIEGYVQRGHVAYDHQVISDKSEEHVVREQLFRVYDVQIDSKSKKLTASARHVSYDLSGNLLGDCVITSAAPATALALIKNALTVPADDVTIATNLTMAEGAYTQTHSWQNGINALLDPDTGFVPTYHAKLVRDNWDMFVYKNDEPDRGMRLTYGSNLVGVTWTRNTDKLINRVIPVAKDSSGNDLYIEELFVDSPLIDAYPVIRMERLQLSVKVGDTDPDGNAYTADTLKAYMRQKAMERYSVDDVDKPKQEIKVSFVLLGDTTEYSQYQPLQKLFMYDTVTVSDPTIGLEQRLQVSATEWDAIRERYTGITLGNVFDYSSRAIAGYELRNGSINAVKLSPAALAELRTGATT